MNAVKYLKQPSNKQPNNVTEPFSEIYDLYTDIKMYIMNYR